MCLIIRVDANTEGGGGHFMRCLALAQEAQVYDVESTFVMAECDEQVLHLILVNGMTLSRLDVPPGSREDAEETARLASERNAKMVVVDGYHFDKEWFAVVHRSKVPVLAVDDDGRSAGYDCDVILNQNVFAEPSRYRDAKPGTRLFLGLDYVLMRREFWSRVLPRDREDGKLRLVITMGYSDAPNATGAVLDALSANEDVMEVVDLVAVIGSGNPHLHELEVRAQTSAGRITLALQPAQIREIFESADLAIIAGGSTMWELLYLGVPVIVLSIADNQRLAAPILHDQGVVLDLGSCGPESLVRLPGTVRELMQDSEARKRMGMRGRSLLGGNGAGRVLVESRVLDFRLRNVEPEDCRVLWEWANEAKVRKASLSSDPIPWENHVRWFEKKLREKDTVMYMAVDGNGESIGQMRFEKQENGEYNSSASIVPSYRGKGLGIRLFRTGCRRFLLTTGLPYLHGYIKTDNETSLATALSAGYVMEGKMTQDGQDVFHVLFYHPLSGGIRGSDAHH